MLIFPEISYFVSLQLFKFCKFVSNWLVSTHSIINNHQPVFSYFITWSTDVSIYYSLSIWLDVPKSRGPNVYPVLAGFNGCLTKVSSLCKLWDSCFLLIISHLPIVTTAIFKSLKTFRCNERNDNFKFYTKNLSVF